MQITLSNHIRLYRGASEPEFLIKWTNYPYSDSSWEPLYVYKYILRDLLALTAYFYRFLHVCRSNLNEKCRVTAQNAQKVYQPTNLSAAHWQQWLHTQDNLVAALADLDPSAIWVPPAHLMPPANNEEEDTSVEDEILAAVSQQAVAEGHKPTREASSSQSTQAQGGVGSLKRTAALELQTPLRRKVDGEGDTAWPLDESQKNATVTHVAAAASPGSNVLNPSGQSAGSGPVIMQPGVEPPAVRPPAVGAPAKSNSDVPFGKVLQKDDDFDLYVDEAVRTGSRPGAVQPQMPHSVHPAIAALPALDTSTVYVDFFPLTGDLLEAHVRFAVTEVYL